MRHVISLCNFAMAHVVLFSTVLLVCIFATCFLGIAEGD